MEYVGFLKLPHQNDNILNIISWNIINGAKTKLEKVHVYNFLSEYDIISLNEVKTPLLFVIEVNLLVVAPQGVEVPLSW